MAAFNGHLETAKLLMAYGADLNARTNDGHLPIDDADDEEIRQAICDEPMDEAPGKRATEQDRHPNVATQQDKQEEEEPSSKRPRLEGGTVAEDVLKVAEEDEDSEPSDKKDDNWDKIRIR